MNRFDTCLARIFCCFVVLCKIYSLVNQTAKKCFIRFCFNLNELSKVRESVKWRALHALVPSMLACPCARVPACPNFWRALVPSMLTYPRALVSTCPNFWHALMPSMLACPRALVWGKTFRGHFVPEEKGSITKTKEGSSWFLHLYFKKFVKQKVPKISRGQSLSFSSVAKFHDLIQIFTF